MATDATVAPPEIPENLAEIVHELKEHGRSAPVVTPRTVVILWVFHAFWLTLAALMVCLPAWVLQTALNKKQVIRAEDVALSFLMIVGGFAIFASILPFVIRIPRWVSDTRAYGTLALHGGLPTLFYLGCAYHAVQVALRAHEGTGLTNKWHRRWVADYLLCPECVKIVGRKPPSPNRHRVPKRRDTPEKRAYLVGAACLLDKGSGLNDIADAWRCVEALGRLYLDNPGVYPKALPVLQHWLQVVYSFRKLEKAPDEPNVEQVLARCAFIMRRTTELFSESAEPPVRTVRPTELWIASWITIALWSVVVALTVAFGTEKCIGAYVTALGITFTAWFALAQAFRARKKEAETRIDPFDAGSAPRKAITPQLGASSHHEQ